MFLPLIVNKYQTNQKQRKWGRENGLVIFCFSLSLSLTHSLSLSYSLSLSLSHSLSLTYLIALSLPFHSLSFFCSSFEGFSGADLAALVREAGLAVVREMMIKSSQPSRGSNDITDSTTSVHSNSLSAPSSSVTISTHCANSTNDITSPSTTAIDNNDVSNGVEDNNDNDITDRVCISSRHFEAALNRVRPSVALHDRQR